LPSEKPLQRLNDILENIEWIFQYTKGLRFRTFVEDRLTRDAVERCLLRISEADRKLEGIVDELVPDQPWADIRSLGNAIRHEYDSIDAEAIWSIIEDDLVPLADAVEAAIQKLERRK
jgi:uncharacterized protein with HEPN domain